MKLSVVIPAYNEEDRLPPTLKSINEYFKSVDYDYEIIVVNGGSSDGTAKVTKELMNSIDNLKLLDRENYGKGYSTREGLKEAKGDYAIFTDADNSTTINQIEKMWPEFEKGFDVVIGSRDIKGAELTPAQPWWRQIVGNVFNLMVQIVVGLWGIWDTQCGFKAFKREVIEEVIPKCKIQGFAFDPEILILAKRAGYKIKEIPVTWRNDPDSKVDFGSMINMGKDLLKVRLNLILNKYKIK